MAGPHRVKLPPTWVAEPVDAEVPMGGAVTLPCAAEGSPPPTVLWKKESGPSPSPYQDLNLVMANYKILPNGTLRVEGARPEDRGYYLCQATSGIGTELSKVVYLTVHVPARFALASQNTTVARGGAATLECRAEGDKPIAIEWFRNGRRFDVRHHQRASLAEQEEAWGAVSKLTLRRAHRDDSAAFACVASNLWGSDRAERVLLVHEPPEPPRALRAVALSGRAANLSWEPAHDGNSPVTAFVVQYKNVSDFVRRAADPPSIFLHDSFKEVRWTELMMNLARKRLRDLE
ncbi:Protein sidekick [Gryllus bimaculatus]|nr:Protein sidekick [Gryllus bimaculatus]